MNIPAPDPHYTIGTLVQRIAALENALTQAIRELESLRKQNAEATPDAEV